MDINKSVNKPIKDLHNQPGQTGVGNLTAQRQEIEKKIFLQKEELASADERKLSAFIDWSWVLIRKPVMTLFVLQVTVYILAWVPSLKLIMQRAIDPLLLLVNLAVFGWLASEAKLKHNKKMGLTVLAVFSAGVFLGILTALFKFFWIREYWTIFNLVIEPVYTGLLAAGVGWLAFIFTKKN